jgi:hypothetical protein
MNLMVGKSPPFNVTGHLKEFFVDIPISFAGNPHPTSSCDNSYDDKNNEEDDDSGGLLPEIGKYHPAKRKISKQR